MHRLRPRETIQKLLISTTSRLTGEYESDLLLVAHAHPNFRSPHYHTQLSESPLSRSTYVVTFETEPIAKLAGIVLPDYSTLGDLVCIYLSILFGKRFDNHGLIEGVGIFHIPDFYGFQTLTQPKLPQNSHTPRQDIHIPLHLQEIARIEPLLNCTNDKFLKFLQTAGRFYLQALQNF